MLLDDTLQLLAHEHRRKIMYVMEETEEDTFSYDDISDGLIDRGFMREEEEERFETQMAHSLLPRMEESGVLEYDKRSETIRYIQDENVEDLLEFIKQFEE